MAKKNRNLQKKLLKHQQLQRIAQGTAPVEMELSISEETIAETGAIQKLPKKIISLPALSGIWHTLISTIIVIILLVVAVIINHKTTYLTQAGNWLYNALKLGNS